MTVHEFTIDRDHPALPGHFPGAPVVPGVVLLEHVLEAIGDVGGPLRLPRVKFMQPLLPGETAQVRLETMTSRDDGARRWRFRVCRDGVDLAMGEVVQG